MNIRARARNAREQLKRYAAELEMPEEARTEASVKAANTINCERDIYLAEVILPQITNEEWKRLHHGIIGLNDREELMACKDIKVKYDLTWSEMESFRNTEKERPQDKYNKANTRQIKLRLNLKTDKDILDKLDSLQGSKQGYIKGLIRRDLEGQAVDKTEKPIYSWKYKNGWFDSNGNQVSEEVEKELNKLLPAGNEPTEDTVEIPYTRKLDQN